MGKMVPSLRFPEFSEKWEENKLGDIAGFHKGKGIAKDDIDEKGKLRCIRYGELYTRYSEIIDEVISRTNIKESNAFLSKEGDVIIPASGESAIDIATASCVKRAGVALGGDINVIRSEINSEFLAYYLSNQKKNDIARYAQGISVMHLYSAQLKSLNIKSPKSSIEAGKISTFLASIDARIANLHRKSDLLSTYNRGIVQRILSQELRFKKEGGGNFSEWEGRMFGEFIVSRNETPDSGQELPLYSLTIENGIEPKSKRYVRSFLVNSEDDAYKVVYPNDFALNPMNLRFGAIAKNNYDNKVLLSKYYDIFSCDETVDADFFELYLQSYEMINYYNRMATGTLEEKKRVHFSEFVKFKKLLPSLDEQRKISSFVGVMNKGISQVQTQIIQLKTFKKALLQKMFI